MNLADVIISAGRCQSEEEADRAISTMLSPYPDRNTMAEVYQTVLGYNPITYFSENEIRKAVADIIKGSDSLREYLNNEDISSERIVEMAKTIHFSHVERDQILSIKEAIWALCPSLPDDVKDEIRDLYVPEDAYELNSFDDEEEDDDDFEGEEEDEDDEGDDDE